LCVDVSSQEKTGGRLGIQKVKKNPQGEGREGQGGGGSKEQQMALKMSGRTLGRCQVKKREGGGLGREEMKFKARDRKTTKGGGPSKGQGGQKIKEKQQKRSS